MAGKVTVKFHYDAFGDLRRDAAVDAELRVEAHRIAAKANALAGLKDGYQVFSAPSKSRSRYLVSAVSDEAKRLESTKRCLTRALAGG